MAVSVVLHSLIEFFLANNFDRFSIPNYNVFFASRLNNDRGGVAIYLKNSFISNQISHPCLFNERILESVLVKFSLQGGFKGLVLSLYRPNTHPDLSYNDQALLFLELFLVAFSTKFFICMPLLKLNKKALQPKSQLTLKYLFARANIIQNDAFLINNF